MGDNTKAYIHEIIDISGINRANYMHHMAANWSPHAQAARNQQLFGMWAVIGSTGPWPKVCNIWEEDGFDGLAHSFQHEAVGPGGYDETLETWWRKAAEFRSGGFDRILLPAPWMPTIGEQLGAGDLNPDGVFAHEVIRCTPGRAEDLLSMARTLAAPAYETYGWRLAGAWTTAMRDDDEAVLLWSVPTYARWAAAETAQRRDRSVLDWREAARTIAVDWHRTLLANAPLCPFRTGRQPSVDDQVDWPG